VIRLATLTISVLSEWQLHHPRDFHTPLSQIRLPGSSVQTFPEKVATVKNVIEECLPVNIMTRQNSPPVLQCCDMDGIST
jgi:hypothetical protein